MFKFTLSTIILSALLVGGAAQAAVDHDARLERRSESELTKTQKEERAGQLDAMLRAKPTKTDSAAQDAQKKIKIGDKLAAVDARIDIAPVLKNSKVYPTDIPELAGKVHEYLKIVSKDNQKTQLLSDAQLQIESDIQKGAIQARPGHLMMFAMAHLIAEASPTQLSKINVASMKAHFTDYLQSPAAEKNFLAILENAAEIEALHPLQPLRDCIKEAVTALQKSKGVTSDEKTRDEITDCAT